MKRVIQRAVKGAAVPLAVAAHLFVCAHADAADFDPFGTNRLVSASPATPLTGPDASQSPCNDAAAPATLDLALVAEFALCNNPETRQSWENARLQAAQVGLAHAAYLPTVDMSAYRAKGYFDSTVRNIPELDYQLHGIEHDVALNLTWTLYDFGLRKANLDNAVQLLHAANFTQDATLQSVFENAAQAYYDLQTAQGALDAGKDAEASAEENFRAAEAKYRAGVGSLADKLQAQTNYNKARLDRIKAEGDAKAAHGALAAAMGLPVDTGFALAETVNAAPGLDFTESIDQLLELAKQQHPSLLAAQAQVKAAQANIAAARAQGLPTLSLVGTADKNKQPGQYSFDTTTNSNTIGLQLRVPLFEGLGRSYSIQAAKAQWRGKVADLAQAEKQVSLEVWKSYQALRSETENMQASEELLQSATLSFDVAQGRYKSGVGTMIELLNAQTALVVARQQKIKNLSDWRFARLRLAASLGQLRLSALTASTAH